MDRHLLPRDGGPAHEDGAPARLNARRPVLPSEVAVFALLVLAALLIAMSLSDNRNFQWDVFARYLTANIILSGLWVTLALTVLATALGLVLGFVLAAIATSGLRPLRWAAAIYIWLSRGTPVLVHLLLWFNLALFIPVISIGIPFVWTFYQMPTNQLITSFTASVLGLGLAEAAYMAEIVRGGLNSPLTKSAMV